MFKFIFAKMSKLSEIWQKKMIYGLNNPIQSMQKYSYTKCYIKRICPKSYQCFKFFPFQQNSENAPGLPIYVLGNTEKMNRLFQFQCKRYVTFEDLVTF